MAKTQASTHFTVCVLKFIFNIFSLLLHGTLYQQNILYTECTMWKSAQIGVFFKEGGFLSTQTALECGR